MPAKKKTPAKKTPAVAPAEKPAAAKKGAQVLATDVHVRQDGRRVLCEAGTTPDKDLTELITNPAAWVDAD